MRDLGGIPTAEGKTIKYGRLIRSGRLCKLPPKTVKALQNMKVDNIIDMRTPREIQSRPPTLIGGAKYHYLPLVATATENILSGKSMTGIIMAESKRLKKELPDARSYIAVMYDILAFHPDSVEVFKKIFRLFLEEENCILWHCNSGTDRTGIVAMLIQSALGVDKQVIMEDYMASFRFLKRRRYMQMLGLVLVPASMKLKKLLHAFMFIKPENLKAVMDKMEQKYGSVLGYIKTELNVTDDEIALLKDKYLE